MCKARLEVFTPLFVCLQLQKQARIVAVVSKIIILMGCSKAGAGRSVPGEGEHGENMKHCCFPKLSPIDIVENKSLGFLQSHCSHSKIRKQFLPSVQSACSRVIRNHEEGCRKSSASHQCLVNPVPAPVCWGAEVQFFPKPFLKASSSDFFLSLARSQTPQFASKHHGRPPMGLVTETQKYHIVEGRGLAATRSAAYIC